VFVAGHVLDLSQVVMFQPVGDYTGPDLPGVLDVRVDFPEVFKKVVQAVFYVLTAVYTGKKLSSLFLLWLPGTLIFHCS